MTVDSCPFCHPDRDRVFHRGELILGLWDGFPVSNGHALLDRLLHRCHVMNICDRSYRLRDLDLAGQGLSQSFFVSVGHRS